MTVDEPADTNTPVCIDTAKETKPRKRCGAQLSSTGANSKAVRGELA
jgi:hypothetical protein